MPEITQEELEQFNRYKELGEPDAIAQGFREREELARTATVNRVSEITGYKPSVLTTLTKDLQLKVEGDKAFVGDKPIDEYAKEHWADFMDSLKPSSTTVPFVKQPSRSSAQTSSGLSQSTRDYIRNTYGQPKEAVTVH